jgi:cysteine desulfurase family protein
MIYLDNAASSHPKPEAVYKAADEALRLGANPGRSGHGSALSAARIIHETRELAAKLLGAGDSSRIIFTSNATHAINIALKGFSLKPGDHVVTSSMEHNSILRPLHALQQSGVDICTVTADSTGVIDPEEVERAIKPQARLVALSHGSNVTGALLDLKSIGEICRKKRVALLLDASQTAGVVPIDVVRDGVTMLTAPGHKGLLGPQGTGILYVSPSIDLNPLMEGGTGFASESREMPEVFPERLEAGTMNTPGIAGMGAGISWLLEKGVENIRKKEIEILVHLLARFKEIKGLREYGPADPEKRVAVVSFNLEGVDGAHLGYALDEVFSIAVRVGLHCAPDAHKTIGTFPGGTVRASFGPFNTVADADALCEALIKLSNLK